MSGKVVLPVMVEPRYTVDIDSLFDLQRAEWLVYNAGLDMVDPARRRHQLPPTVALIVFDFDGVLTDNRVWTDENGREMVASNRSDSLGLTLLRSKRETEMLILSRERNPVVSARAKKINVPVIQSVDDKATALNALIAERKLNPSEVIYVGNDVNDLPCLPLVGCFIAPADAHPEVRRRADIVLKNPGGQGAVRELCDWLLK